MEQYWTLQFVLSTISTNLERGEVLGALFVLGVCIGWLAARLYAQMPQSGTERKSKNSELDPAIVAPLRQRLDHIMHIERLYLQEDLALDSVAQCMDISPRTLSTFLNQIYGQNYSQYLNDTRIAAACKLLEDDLSKTVLEIAFAVGFGSKSTFYRAFRERHSMTPAVYRLRQAQRPKLLSSPISNNRRTVTQLSA